MTFRMTPIGAVFDVFNGATPSSGDERCWDGDIPWVTPADLGSLRSRFIREGSRNITAEGYASCGTQLVPPGTIVMSIRAPIGHMAIAERAMCFNQGCRGLVPRGSIRSDFAYWALLARRPQLEAAGQGSTFMELGRSRLRAEKIPLPGLSEQKAIADFLDRETARIDQLIEKKQQLVVLLSERERNLISECLVRGLDRSAPLEHSSIEWLGEVPRHWKIFPLKVLIWYQEGPGILAEDFQDEGIPLLRIKGLSGSHATLKGCNFLDPDKVRKRWNHFRVEVGDLLISASATQGGVASMVTEETKGAVPYTGIIRIKPRPGGYIPDIIRYFLLSTIFDTQIDLLSAGATIQHFGPSHLARMKAPLPPHNEQIKIAQFLNERVPLLQAARQKTEHSQECLRQFRSALVSAVVTGQIDIARWANHGHLDRRLDEIEREMAS